MSRFSLLFLLFGSFAILFHQFYVQIGLVEDAHVLAALSLLFLLWNPLWMRIFAYDGISDFITLTVPIAIILFTVSIKNSEWKFVMFLLVVLLTAFPFLQSIGFIPLSLSQMASIVLSLLLFFFPSCPTWILPLFLLTSSIPSPLLIITHTLSLLLILQTRRIPLSLTLLLFLCLLMSVSSFASSFTVSLLPSLTLHSIHILFTRSSSQLKFLTLVLLLSFLFLLFCILRVNYAEAAVSILPAGSLHNRITEMIDLQEVTTFAISNSTQSMCSIDSLKKQYPDLEILWNDEESVYYALKEVMCDLLLIAPLHDGLLLNGKCNDLLFSFLCNLLSTDIGREDAAVHFMKVYETTNHMYHVFRFSR